MCIRDSFLGMCSYLAVPKNVKTAVGLGIAVTFVLLVTLPVNYLLQTKVLAANAIIEGVDLKMCIRDSNGSNALVRTPRSRWFLFRCRIYGY